MIGHECRYSTYFTKIKDLLAEGAVGTPHVMWCHEFRRPFLKKVNQWIIDARFSGGALVDKNCHHFDLWNWWSGARPVRVSAFGRRSVNVILDHEHEVIDQASVSVEYDNGMLGTLVLCMFAPDREEGLRMGVIGDRGLLETQLERGALACWQRGEPTPPPAVYNFTAEELVGHSGFTEEHAAFFDAIRTRRDLSGTCGTA